MVTDWGAGGCLGILIGSGVGTGSKDTGIGDGAAAHGGGGGAQPYFANGQKQDTFRHI